MKKDVFILGAGFSKSVDAPLQSELLPEILAFDSSKFETTEQDIYDDCRNSIRDLLESKMYLDLGVYPDLEDIFSPLDNCISNRISFRNIPFLEVLEYRKKLNILITMYMKRRLDEISSKGTYIDSFTQKIIE